MEAPDLSLSRSPPSLSVRPARYGNLLVAPLSTPAFTSLHPRASVASSSPPIRGATPLALCFIFGYAAFHYQTRYDLRRLVRLQHILRHNYSPASHSPLS